jgi:hypothetical protein
MSVIMMVPSVLVSSNQADARDPTEISVGHPTQMDGKSIGLTFPHVKYQYRIFHLKPGRFLAETKKRIYFP